MDLIEFSIACKLISLKLRNVEVPKLLPPTLIASLKHIGTPIRTPTGTMSPVEGYKQFLPPVANIQQVAPEPIAAQQQIPLMQVQPMVMPQVQAVVNPVMNQQMPMMAPQVPMMAPQVPMMAPQVPMMAPQVPMMAPQIPQANDVQAYQQPLMQPDLMAQQVMMSQPQMIPKIIPMSQPQIVPNVVPMTVQPVKPSLIEQLSSGSLLDSLNQTHPATVTSGPIPAAPTPTPPQSGQASRSMSFSEKAPSVPESP